MLERVGVRAGSLVNRRTWHSLVNLCRDWAGNVHYRRLAIFGGFSILGLIVLLPMLGRDLPPGVDSPTFLHLSWVVEQAISGNLDNPFSDPYWYGGFPYLEAYPPLGYGVVGVIGAIPGFSFVVVYQTVLVLALGGVGFATYLLGQEYGLRWWSAGLAAVLATISYPILSAIYLWGWFTSIVALPFALLAVMLLEKGARRGERGLVLWGGIALGTSALIHHMTGAAFAIALIGWLITHFFLASNPWRRNVKYLVLFGAVTGLVVLPWGIPFLIHMADVGFRRELAGNWISPLAAFQENIWSAKLIGIYLYPSYLANPFLIGLVIAGTSYALVGRHRVAAAAAVLLVLTWFSLGKEGNPLIGHYPFSGLDVARFPMYMIPLMALMAAWLVDTLARALEPLRSHLAERLSTYVWVGGIAVVVVGILVLPVKDLGKTMSNMDSYHVEEPMSQALDWIESLPGGVGDNQAVGLYCVGCWNWDVFLIPQRAKVAVVDGWADEGAPNVDLVRSLRRIVWNFPPFVGSEVQGDEVHQLLRELGTTHVLLAPYYPLEDTSGFQREFRKYPELFVLRQTWADLEMYEVLDES